MKKTIGGFFAVSVVFIMSVYILVNYHLPYCGKIIGKVSGVCEQYRVARDTGSIHLELHKKKHEIVRIDSLLQLQRSRESAVKKGLIDALYVFADSAKTQSIKSGSRGKDSSQKQT
jgi:hypothetical protein